MRNIDSRHTPQHGSCTAEVKKTKYFTSVVQYLFVSRTIFGKDMEEGNI